MLANALRDAELLDHARDAIAPLDAYLDQAAQTLIRGHRARSRRRHLLRAALRHGIAFSTWRSLTTNSIARAEAVTLITAFVEAAADSPLNSSTH